MKLGPVDRRSVQNHAPVPFENLAARREEVSSFDFRKLHPQLRFGTASDRYAGWIGQIYSDESAYAGRVTSRRRKLGGLSFVERQLPIDSVREYFEHFSVLELDFTFYRPLFDEAGVPTTNYGVVERYAEHAPEHGRFLLKAPQMFFARRVRRTLAGKVSTVENPDFLNLDRYVAEFHEPLQRVLGDRVGGILFEQEYQRIRGGPDPMDNVVEFDGFFSRIPRNFPIHIELRSGHLLTAEYFDWLETQGIGHVFSHWTWLPSLKTQWQRSGERLTSADKNVVVRLLTPRKMTYADAYRLASPFDKAIEELSERFGAHEMLDEATALAYQALRRGNTIDIISNNRAWGNAPELAQAVANRVLDFTERLAPPEGTD